MSVSSIHHLAERRLVELGITLPAFPKPVANYLPFTISGNLLFISGKGPRTAEQNLLSVVHHAQNGLSTVRRVVKLTGFVNASEDFRDHPKVINGCSDLLVDVFGDAGKHARSAVGVNSLPENITVEIEAIFEIS